MGFIVFERLMLGCLFTLLPDESNQPSLFSSDSESESTSLNAACDNDRKVVDDTFARMQLVQIRFGFYLKILP